MTMRVLAIHHEDWKQYLLRAASRRKHQNLGSLEEVIREAGWRCDYHESAIGQSLRTDLDRYSHVIVLGGNISAYEDDKHGFLREEMRIIERALDRSVPVLGICLGAQLLARIYGARVYPGPAGPELAWQSCRLTEVGRSEPLLRGFAADSFVFQWHYDTFDLPTGADRLAGSAHYENQAFRVGRLAWALQFHLEANWALIRAWMRSYADEATTDAEVVRRDTERHIADYTAAATVFLRGFLGVGRPPATGDAPPADGFPGLAGDRERAG
jgi:GMP synthase (glutamine-hydrolysing)